MDNKYFCAECFDEQKFNKLFITETIKVKGIEITNTHEYWECEDCKELFEPLDNPDKNILSDYELYKKIEGLSQVNEILDVRNMYKLSQRDFSKILGISYSTLSNIENGSLQSVSHDSLFESAKNPYTFKSLLIKRKKKLKPELFEETLKLIDSLTEIWDSERYEIYRKLNDKADTITSRINMLEHELSQQISKNEGRDEKWKVSPKITNMFGHISRM